jgi:hypothetical protein
MYDISSGSEFQYSDVVEAICENEHYITEKDSGYRLKLIVEGIVHM